MKTYNCKRKPKHFTKGKYRRKGLYEVRYSKKSSQIYNFGCLFPGADNEEIVCDKYDIYPLVEKYDFE